MYNLKIKVTKDILEKSSMCGLEENPSEISTNCAFSLATRDIFPNAWVGKDFICTDSSFLQEVLEKHKEGVEDKTYQLDEAIGDYPSKFIRATKQMREFIFFFDSLLPRERKMMTEQEFNLPIPDAVIDDIDIEEVKTVLQNSPVLKLEEV